MKKFIRFALVLGVIFLTSAATAAGVIYSFRLRGRFAIGGEWLIPAVVAAVWAVVREIKRTWRFTANGNNPDNTKNR